MWLLSGDVTRRGYGEAIQCGGKIFCLFGEGRAGDGLVGGALPGFLVLGV